jgi:hypothetical protein
MAIGPRPITRDAFLYMEHGDAQCGTCWLFNTNQNRCIVLPFDFEVRAEDSCGYYGPTQGAYYLDDEAIAPRFTPEEVGFVKREVRCENCYHFDKKESLCYLFDTLNRNPKIFDLNTKVSPKGCCNAQTPRRPRAT